MELFWKAAAAAMITSVLTLVLSKQQKDISLMLSMAVCAMGIGILASFLEPVMAFLRQLRDLGDLNGDMLVTLLKAVGIGLVSEIAAMVCADAGNGSLGKTLQMVGSGAILWLSLPVFETLMNLIQKILGEV